MSSAIRRLIVWQFWWWFLSWQWCIYEVLSLKSRHLFLPLISDKCKSWSFISVQTFNHLLKSVIFDSATMIHTSGCYNYVMVEPQWGITNRFRHVWSVCGKFVCLIKPTNAKRSVCISFAVISFSRNMQVKSKVHTQTDWLYLRD